MAEKLHSEGMRSEEALLQSDLAVAQSYFVLLGLSGILITLALLSGSITVEGGAILVSPLMVPLSALAVGLAEGKAREGLKSLLHLSWSIVLVIATGFLVSLLVPVVELPSLVALRSQPSLHDLFIAIVAGAIGMYGYLRKDISTHLSGVAASVSLMPPLAVIGIALAEGYYPVLWGAAALFLTNVVAIVAAAAVVLVLMGKHPHGRQLKISLAGWVAVGALLVSLVAFLGNAFWEDIHLGRLRQQARGVLEQELNTENIPLDTLKLTETDGKLKLRATNVPVSETQSVLTLPALQQSLMEELGQPVELEISFQQTYSTVAPSPTP
jgi:uncharacterized hydrophobic protein (TIGR00271 family)